MTRADRRESRRKDEQEEGKNLSKTQLQLINNVKMNLKGIKHKRVNRIYLALNTGLCQGIARKETGRRMKGEKNIE